MTPKVYTGSFDNKGQVLAAKSDKREASTRISWTLIEKLYLVRLRKENFPWIGELGSLNSRHKK